MELHSGDTVGRQLLQSLGGMSTPCSMHSAQIAAVVGIALVVVGTWLVAYEVVKRFLGYSHRVIDVRADGSGVVEKTDAFKKWEMKRAFWMWSGLALITVGSALQIYGTIISGPATP